MPAVARPPASTADGHRSASVQTAGRPLRVLIGLEGLALGGVPINALDLGRELRDRGHHVGVFAIDEEVVTSVAGHATRNGHDLELLPARSGTLARARQMRRLVHAHDADVLHVFGPWLGQAATLAVTPRSGCGAFVTNWTMENVTYVPRRTPLILGTRRLRDEAEGIQRRPVHLMEPPVDLRADEPDPASGLRLRHALGVADDEVAVVVVGRVDSDLKEEGLHHAIAALHRLEAPVRLIIVGDGNAFSRVQAAAARTNEVLGRPAVIMTGALQDPRPAYDAADIALGMGGSALRALAHARPLVVLGQNGFAQTYEPTTRDWFAEHGFFGESATVDPPGQLAALLDPLLDATRRGELSRFGREQVQRYGLAAAADQLEELYRAELSNLPGLSSRLLDGALLTTRAVAHGVRARLEGAGVGPQHAG